MDGMKYGYERVSTDDQTPALQIATLKKAGYKTVFNDDGLSGATTERPALRRCLKKLEAPAPSYTGRLLRISSKLSMARSSQTQLSMNVALGRKASLDGASGTA